MATPRACSRRVAIRGDDRSAAPTARCCVADVHAAAGGNVEWLLAAIGQPASRDGAAYTYCAEDAAGHPVDVQVTFAADGTGTSVDAIPF